MTDRIGKFLDGWVKIDQQWIQSPWNELCEKIRPLRIVDTLLRSCGQVIFADHPLTGFFMLAALAMASQSAFFFALAGAAISSLVAFVMKKDIRYIRHGIFGFNGAILGIFWSWYFLLSLPSFGLFVLASALTVAVQAAMANRLSYGRFNLPIMSMPAAVMMIGSLMTVYWMAFNTGMLSVDQLYLPVHEPFTPLIPLPLAAKSGIGEAVLAHGLHIWATIFLAILLNSRLSFAVAVLFTAAGFLAIAVLPTSWTARGAEVFLGFNVLPLSIALLGLFIPFGLPAFLYAGLSFFVCLIVWMLLAYAMTAMNLPFLTLPFNVTVILALLLAKQSSMIRSWIATIPLDLVSTPEQISKTRFARSVIQPLPQPLPSLSSPLRTSRQTMARFVEMIDDATKISILSGAGTSTESGIPDFRGSAAYWRQFGAEEFTYQNFLTRHDIQRRYWVMDREFQSLIAAATPTALHQAVRKLDEQGKLECVVTQNVDGLFQQAGLDASKVLEIHGTARKIQCMNCGTVFPRHEVDLPSGRNVDVPYCGICQGLLKPMTVFMGEEINPSVLAEALHRICRSDLLLVVGASLQMEPVASIPTIAWRKGVKIIVVNLDPTPKDHLAAMILRQAGSELFASLMKHARW